MTKLMKTLLRLWIAGISTAGLLFGWIFLAHSGKPAALVTQPAGASITITSPQLEAIPSLEELQANQPGASQLASPVRPSVTFNFPRLRTMGS